jgi:predicted neutral ceramidase superfamily lipid hydrolase
MWHKPKGANMNRYTYMAVFIIALAILLAGEFSQRRIFSATSSVLFLTSGILRLFARRTGTSRILSTAVPFMLAIVGYLNWLR